MTRHDFMAVEGLQGDLNELLKNPLLQLAIEIVSQEGTSRALPRPIPGVSYSEMVSAEGARSIGWAGALSALVSLTNKPMLTRATNLAQSNMYAAEARKRMLETENYTESEIDKFVKENQG